MAKTNRGRRGIASRQCRPTPYPMPSCTSVGKKHTKIVEKKDWEDATCSVCMEFPHNAVLLLCSSHEKGCRPYMCGTSFRYSNCLDMYRKAYTKVTAHESSDCQGEAAKLACPLCRGQVKGWTVVDAARQYLDAKKRSCEQENCSFSGTYQELRKHMKMQHPSAKPREVDPSLEQKWSRLERDRERDDIMSTIRSSTPGAVFFGDYVIEGGYAMDSDDVGVDADSQNEGADMGIDRSLMSVFLFLQAFGSAGNPRPHGGNRRTELDTSNNAYSMAVWNQEGSMDAFDSFRQDESEDENANNGQSHGTSLASRLRRQGRAFLGRSRRRRRRRGMNQEGR